ncbi:hypothetical protein T08_8301 [Trichinella sp. T8]|nr:hypothetical protein T08_8301 [Trichinella sp. T8]
MRSFWSLSTNDHFHPAYYTLYMHKWMGSSENSKSAVKWICQWNNDPPLYI